MENMILIDLETRDFSVHTGGIYEVGAIAIKGGQVVEKLHLGIIEDASLISRGYGFGYEELSYNEVIINEFKNFINKYKFPLVAHNAGFDRKFLLHFQWLSADYPFYDSIRAIKGENLNLPSYSMEYLMAYTDMSKCQTHTALDDVEVLFEILKIIKPKNWFPIGARSKKTVGSFYPKLTALKEEYEVENNIFNGKTIAFTGKSNYSRNKLIELAKKAGAISNSDSVTKKTNILVIGEKCGSKLEKAKKMGIDIITIDDFIKIINQHEGVI